MSDFTQDLTKMISDLMSSKKPQTKEDAIKIWHDLELIVCQWVISELPPSEKKTALITMWKVKEMHTKCLPWL
jgi:hypothetical protein